MQHLTIKHISDIAMNASKQLKILETTNHEDFCVHDMTNMHVLKDALQFLSSIPENSEVVDIIADEKVMVAEDWYMPDSGATILSFTTKNVKPQPEYGTLVMWLEGFEDSSMYMADVFEFFSHLKQEDEAFEYEFENHLYLGYHSSVVDAVIRIIISYIYENVSDPYEIEQYFNDEDGDNAV